MNHRFNKRRSCSDEGIGDPSKTPLNFPISSSVSSKTSGKHNSNLRQARMIYPFCMVPQAGIPSNAQNTFVSPQMCSPSLPQPYVTDSSICFTLLPFRNDLNYQFSLRTGPGQRIYATSGSQMPILFPISFALNRIPFINVKLPVDLTGAIQNGSNLISFQQINSTQPIFLTICLSPSPQINGLVEKVINEFPQATPANFNINNLGSLPFPTIADPISGRQIMQPCRGVNCTHIQCFDLRSFIEKALNENSWACPICGSMISYENLRYDPSFFDIISQIQQQQQVQQMQQMQQVFQQQQMNNESIPSMNFMNTNTNCGNMNLFKPYSLGNNIGINTPQSAPSQMQIQISISSSASESTSMSTQSDDNTHNSQIQPPPIQQPLPTMQIPQETSLFDDFNTSIDPFNDDFGFNFY